MISRSGAELGIIPMDRKETRFTGILTPPAEPFHIAVQGKDASGVEFRRVHAPLLDIKP